jgi:hypothetical protein
VTAPLTVQQADALWDAIAVPNQKEPRFVEQHERVCHTVAQLLDDATCGPHTILDDIRALRDDLRGTTGARWIADALDRILGEQPAPETTTPDAYRAAVARVESSGPRPTPAQAVRHVHVTITNPDAFTANRAALSLADWINAEFPGHTVTTDAHEWPATAATQATDDETPLQAVARHARRAEQQRDQIGEELDQAAATIADGTVRINQLTETLREILARFTEHGHPGAPCVRTPWLRTTTVDRWRAALDNTDQPTTKEN